MTAIATAQNRNQDQAPRKEWVVVKEFDLDGYRVQVRKLDLFNPRFSVDVGVVLQDGRFSTHMNARSEVENFVVRLKPFDGSAIVKLLALADQYIYEALQERQDQLQARAEHREVRRAGPAVKVARTGKTEREAAKRARHEQNLAARQEADRERTAKAKAGGRK
jgi:hypothetical protein